MARHTRALLVAAMVAGAFSAPARANPEPSAFDARSVSLGATGAAWLDSPAAVVVNPANLTRTDAGALQLTFQPVFVKQWAPVEGSDTRSESGGFGPMLSAFAAYRVNPRWVLGAGIYTTTGYSSGFDEVSAVAGESLASPRDLSVRFFGLEGSLVAGVMLHPRVHFGFGLRLPFASQGSHVYQEIFPDSGGWAWLSQDIRGVGLPGGRFGLRVQLHERVSFGVMYRTKVAIPMSGTTDVELSPSVVLRDVSLSTRWYSPHALQAGFAVTAYGGRLLVAVDYRLQLHQATNQVQIFENGLTTEPLEAPFHFRNVHSLRIGAELSLSERFSIRLGLSRGVSATTHEGIQFFTPPPGPSGSVSGGVGVDLRLVDLSFGVLYSHAEKYVPHDETRCGPGATIKTHCGGEYGLRSLQLSLSVTRRFGAPRPQPPPFSERRGEQDEEREDAPEESGSVGG